TDLAEWQRKDQGAYYSQSEAAARVGGRWMALPHSIVGAQMAYRKSWFDEVGQTTWPRTLEELRLVGLKLKKNGHPIGQTLAHTFGDAPAWAYPMLWNFGAAHTDAAGRPVLARKEHVGGWSEAAGGFSVGANKYWEEHPMWAKLDDAMKIYRTAARVSRMFGYAGPPSKNATKVYSKYIIVDMYAKAVQGLSATDAVAWAAGELQQIYG